MATFDLVAPVLLVVALAMAPTSRADVGGGDPPRKAVGEALPLAERTLADERKDAASEGSAAGPGFAPKLLLVLSSFFSDVALGSL